MTALMFAHTAAEALEAERHAGVRRALELILAGEPGHARFVLLRSFERQLVLAGLRTRCVP
jgi:hypothetical protein